MIWRGRVHFHYAAPWKKSDGVETIRFKLTGYNYD